MSRNTTSNNKTPRGANSLYGSHHGEFLLIVNFYYLCPHIGNSIVIGV